MPSPEEKPEAPLGRLLARFQGAAGEPDADTILAAFLEYTTGLGLSLYPAQEEAILELLAGKHVILSTPTGSGKSLVALALHFQALTEDRISFYTAPTKALVNEKFFALCEALGGERVGLMTGDASVNPGAPVICCTAEILSNLALRGEAGDVDCVVMDEFHFYGDHERGVAWQIPLITMPDTVFLLMSATLGDTGAIAGRLEADTQRQVARVRGDLRPVPLRFSYRDSPLHETIEDLVKAGEAPIYLVNFTQRDCVEQAGNLTSLNLCSKEERQAIAGEIQGARFDTPFGKEFGRFVRQGIGVHHAGLLPKYRRVVERLSQTGLIKVISGTDTLGVGVNIPIRTVIFSQLFKYDGQKTALLPAREFHQISGRAGRKGFDDHGNVVVQAPEWVVENLRIEAKIAANPAAKKKLVKKKPPPGAVIWDQKTFEKLRGSPPEPLKPRFEVHHGMMVNLLQSAGDEPGGGYRRLLRLIAGSHQDDFEKRALRRRSAVLFRSLVRAGVVELVTAPRGTGKRAQVKPGLQLDFSLNHALSLFLVEALELLDPDAPTLALDMLSLVEAILEDPRAVLYRQVDKKKGELVAKLKAEGVEYAERMERLEQVEHDKPLKEFIYQAFNAFAELHPWVADENIRPKSVAREMAERFLSFNEYVNEYGLARSEGVLLRHLTQVYKTAVQNVPETLWNPDFEDLLAILHGIVRRTDSSLLQEWELMVAGPATRPPRGEEPRPAKPRSILDDPRAFTARVRNELHVLVRALATRDFEGAAELLHQSEEHRFTPQDLERAMGAYFGAYPTVDTSPRSRLAEYTILQKEGERVFSVRQRLLDPEGHGEWILDGLVDLAIPRDEAGPLVELRGIHD